MYKKPKLGEKLLPHFPHGEIACRLLVTLYEFNITSPEWRGGVDWRMVRLIRHWGVEL